MVNDINTLNGSLQELGETLAENLVEKGVSASASDGLTTLANKILLVSPSRKLFYKITNEYDLFSALPLNFWKDSEEHINDSAAGTTSFENYSTAESGNAIRRTITGWSNHSIVNIIDHIEDIDISQPFMLETDFYMQDGFEVPGLFIGDSTNFYQISMWSDGGYHERYGNDRTHKICVGKNRYIADNRWDFEDSEIITIFDIHRLRIIFKNNKLTFELRGLASDFTEHLVYSYDMDVDGFTPTQLGLVFGVFGSLDGGGNVIVFNNVKVYQIG